MNPAELYCFIGKCLIMEENPEALSEVRESLSKNTIPWEKFVWMGSLHMILPALYSAFKRNNLTCFLPADLNVHLSEIYYLSKARNQRILNQTQEINRILEKESIEPVYLKGAGYLSQKLYKDMADRVFADIDILIPEPEIYKAGEVLLKGGYFYVEDFYKEEINWHHTYPALKHDGERALVELHYIPVIRKFEKLTDTGRIIREKEKTRSGNAFVPSGYDQILIHFIHTCLTNRGHRWNRILLRNLFDFYLLLQKNPTIEKLQLPRKYQRTFETYRYIASEVFCRPFYLKGKPKINDKVNLRLYKFFLNHPGLSLVLEKWNMYIARVFYLFKLAFLGVSDNRYRNYLDRRIRDRILKPLQKIISRYD